MTTRPTIADIAEKAGVNRSTVSRILNNNRDFALSEELREKVWGIAKRIGYEPSFCARSLALGKTFNIGVVLGRLERSLPSPFMAPMITALIKTVTEGGYTITILPVNETKNLDEELLRTVRQRKVDAYFVTDAFIGGRAKAELSKLGVPAVVYDPSGEFEASDAISVVTIDESIGAEELVRTLLDFGHQRAAYFAEAGGGPHPRLTALSEASDKHGLKLTQNEQFAFQRTTDGYLTDRSESFRAARGMSDRLREHSTIVCSSDLVAMGVADALFDGDFAAADISLIGYDDIEENPNFRCPEPVLSTIDPRKAEVGRQVGELILRNLTRKKPLGEIVRIPTRFIRRRSLLPLKKN